MKKQILLLCAFLVSITVFSQKDEVKAAEKALKANEFSVALSAVEKAESMLAGADQKTTAKVYYIKAKALYQNGSKQADIKEVSAAFDKVISYEKETKKLKYTTEINELSTKLKEGVLEEARTAYGTASETQAEADYKTAADKFYMAYALSKSDTVYLDNAAFLYSKAKDFESANKYSKQLLDMGYTGIATEYIATGEDGKDVYFPDKKSMDTQVKLKLVSNPRTNVKDSRREYFYNSLAENYLAMEEYDKSLEVIKEGRAEFPKSYSLIITEANANFKKGNNTKFKELLEEAVEIDPNNVSLYQNIGVMYKNEGNSEAAMKNFNKVLELDPNNATAYQNIGATILDKSIPIQEEMEKSLSDFDKYDALLEKRKVIYRESLEYYEKSYELDANNIDVVRMLMDFYENLEMTEKFDEIKSVYENLKG